MRDQPVRTAFHKTVLKSAHADFDTIVVDELGLKNGSIRADIAVLNGKLVGYEIKTESDTLYRLPSQIEAYNEVFDKVFIIVGDRHLQKTIETVPPWWGIYQINTGEDGEYCFTCYRDGKANKSQNPFTLAQLLWKSEALELANKVLRHNVKPQTPKKEIYDIISGTCSKKKLSKVVIQYLKKRDNWRADRL